MPSGQLPRTLQPPPELPDIGSGQSTLANYLRIFSLWCRHGFADKISGSTAAPGLMLQAYNAVAGQLPATWLLQVGQGGNLWVTPIAAGSGDAGTPIVPYQIGVSDGSNASAGQVGEFQTASGTVASMASSVYTNLASMTLSAGDWNVWGRIVVNVTPSSANIQGGIVTTSGGTGQHFIQAGPTMTNVAVYVGPIRFSITVSTVVYLVGFAVYTPGSCNGGGNLYARRVR